MGIFNREVSPPDKFEDPRARIGNIVAGRFALKNLVGTGGNGFVYEAEDRATGRVVAVKVPRQSRRVDYSRFRREAIAGASIWHPNVCTIYAFGHGADGAPFLAMEWLRGETLSVRLRRDGRLPWKRAVFVIQQVLAGLSAAHAHGIIHRDMKPANIFLIASPYAAPVVKVLDFGCSTAKGGVAEPADAEPLTNVGAVVGTPDYMSPEQVRGERDFDQRVDIFACGTILYEMVTGRRPFAGHDVRELFERISEGQYEVPTPSLRLPRSFDKVLARALAAERGDRYPSADAFADALGGLEALPVSTPSERVMSSERAERLAHLRARFHDLAALHGASVDPAREPAAPTPEIPIVVELNSDTGPTLETTVVDRPPKREL